MKWIKATEKLPDHYHEIPIKICDGGPEMYALGQRQHSQEYFQDNVNLNYYPYDQIQWLDESEPVQEDQDVLWDEFQEDLLNASKYDCLTYPTKEILRSKFTLTRKHP